MARESFKNLLLSDASLEVFQGLLRLQAGKQGILLVAQKSC